MIMQELLNFAKKLVREAGDASLFGDNGRSVLSETVTRGPLTIGDLKLHELIQRKIKERFPDHTFFSEEGERKQILHHTWICDPICGTYNYIRGIPYFAIGLSYLLDGRIRFSIVYNPVSRELFHAVKGEGSYLNDLKIRVSSVTKLSEGLVDFNVNFYSSFDQERGKKLFSLLCPPIVARLRLTESANLSLAYVACGRYDAYLHPSDKIWDKTAGKLLVEEAGGKVLDFSKVDRFTLLGKGVLAANGTLMKPLKIAISEIFEE